MTFSDFLLQHIFIFIVLSLLQNAELTKKIAVMDCSTRSISFAMIKFQPSSNWNTKINEKLIKKSPHTTKKWVSVPECVCVLESWLMTAHMLEDSRLDVKVKKSF